MPRPPCPTLFPYTTLFRSWQRHRLATPPNGPNNTTRRHSRWGGDRKSTRLNSSHVAISYAVFCLKKKTLISRNMHDNHLSTNTSIVINFNTSYTLDCTDYH